METQFERANQGKMPDPANVMVKQVKGESVTSSGNDDRVRCAIYARYSSENQHESSIDDQIRNCREAADRKGWIVLDDYIFSDKEKTGTTIHGRIGLKTIMDFAKAKPKPFEYIIVDDTSRFGRNKADSFKNVDILNFYKVYLHFVEDGLDSSEPWFERAFHDNAQRDAQYSKSLGHKVRRGKRGRFINGYNPGVSCYGYRNIPDEDLTRKGEYGRPAVNGVYQVIVPEEAAIVKRIFRMYAIGMSLRAIAGILNDEGVPTSQRPRTRRKAAWCMSAIREMLKNTRYIGKTVWGRTRQDQNPETGKMQKRDVPESEWEHRDQPELRIISDELWTEVQEQFVRATRGFGVKRLGGMNRTEASRKYLFGGLLRCGLCGGRMNLTGAKPPRYGCANHREQKTCANKATVPLELLERQFVSALSEKLHSEDLREELVQALLQNLRDGKNKRLSEQEATVQEHRDLEQRRETLTIQIENLVRAVKECGGSRALLAELAETEAAYERVSQRLESASKPPSRDITEDEVREFLNETANSFKEVLLGAPEAVKHAFQKRISSITLTPTADEMGPVYRVSGDVDLFSSPEHVLQSNPVELIALQYTIPISFDLVPYQYRQKWAA